MPAPWVCTRWHPVLLDALPVQVNRLPTVSPNIINRHMDWPITLRSFLRPLPLAQGLSTFGFRGEALSSLCAVAEVSVTTRTAEQDAGATEAAWPWAPGPRPQAGGQACVVTRLVAVPRRSVHLSRPRVLSGADCPVCLVGGRRRAAGV